MKFIRTIACPVCGKMNEVPDNLEELVRTIVFRSSGNTNKIDIVSRYLSDLSQDIRNKILYVLEAKERIDPNDFIDITCLNQKSPYGRHTFRFDLKTGDVSK